VCEVAPRICGNAHFSRLLQFGYLSTFYTHYLAKTMTLTLRRHDVKMGRGRGNDEWVGNIAFRRIVREHKAVYQQAPKDGKVAIAEAVVNAVIEDGGRFLQKAAGMQGYVTVSWATAVEKASQALREKAWVQVATVAAVATATKLKKPPYKKKKKKQQQRLEVVVAAAVAAVDPTLVPGRTTVRFVDHAATSTTAPWSEEPSPPPPPQDALPELSLFVAATSSSGSGSHNGANSMPSDDQNGLALVVAASSVELETAVPNSVLVVTTTTTTMPPLPLLGLAAFSPPCTTTAVAPWCCALEEDYTPNHFNQDCLVQGYAAPRPSASDDYDDDDTISVSNDDEEINSVGMFDFDPMQAWHSLLHFGPSASPTSTLFFD
jgi:hypothetical protein